MDTLKMKKAIVENTGLNPGLSSFIVLICFCLFLFSTRLEAAEETVTLVLFKGEVHLIDKAGHRHSVRIGQEISVLEFSGIENGQSSILYLKTGKKLMALKQAGVHLFNDLFVEKRSVFENTLAFLKDLAQPRAYTSQSRVRGDSETMPENDAVYFEDLWEQIALESETIKTGIATEDLIAAAAWFHQGGKPVRTAYILERLNSSASGENDFYQQLRLDSLQNVTLTEIRNELENTRDKINNRFESGNHKALLIGINQYQDPNWQTLKTPIQDVRELKDLLIKEYLFEEQDVILLENAGFEEIIGAFNEVRKIADNKTNLLVYFAGHGYYPPGEEEGYWIPSDAGNPETQKLFLPTSTVLSKIKSIRSKHTLVMADSCFSGSLVRQTRGSEINSRYFRDLSDKKSRQIITSGGLEPVSDQGWGDNSIFAGKLLEILSRQRSEPLSASELALNLRKEVKNANALQTPEYGRLHVVDDENGEFFFIRKDQKLTEIAQLSEEDSLARGAAEQEESEFWGSEQELQNREGYRLNMGFGFHIAVLNYKFTYIDNAGEEKTESDSTSLTGTVMHFGLKRVKNRVNYELTTSLGQLSASSVECREEDQNTEFCSAYADSSVSGRYVAAGTFATYNVLPIYSVDIDMGGGFVYQKYSFRKLLDARDLDTAFISACVRYEITFLAGEWFLGTNGNFCMKAFETGGTLNDYENGSLSDLQIPLNMHFSAVAAYKF
jgi:caspase domain-containing protein